MGLMDKFANPELFESLSFGEKMVGSTITMLMGMGITFMILLILWGFVALMGKFLGTGMKKTNAPVPAASTPAPAAAAAASAPPSNDSEDQIIAAVIAAAVAAYQGSGGTENLVVRKITRLSGETTFWTNAGREECIESRKF